MTPETVNLIVAVAAGVAVGVICLSALIAALSLWRVSRDVRRVARSLDAALDVVNAELPATLKELRQSATNLGRVSAELEPRVARVDALLDEADASLQSLRATVEAAEDLVRGPAAAIDRARRTMNAAGQGIARGADRLRRGVQDMRR
jgi:ABC-type transporter Mla subunit MlaD